MEELFSLHSSHEQDWSPLKKYTLFSKIFLFSLLKNESILYVPEQSQKVFSKFLCHFRSHIKPLSAVQF